jgi:hypothetical protein
MKRTIALATATDDLGQFKIPNVPPETAFYLYTRMEDMRFMGLALPAQAVVTGVENSTLDLSDLKARPAHRITGRVVLADDQPVPRFTELHLTFANVRDLQKAAVGSGGDFEFTAVPPMSIELSLFLNGYRLTAKNPSRDPYVPMKLIGRVDKDLDDFVIHVEPYSSTRAKDDVGSSGSAEAPLRGAKL